MKTLYLILLSIFFTHLAQSQTILRFLPVKSSANSKVSVANIGKIVQVGESFNQNLRVELPDKILDLNLKPSRLKQYDNIITSEGEIPSKVELFEDKNSKGTYFLATIDKQFYSLLMLENDEAFSLQQTKDAQFLYQKVEQSKEPFACGIDDYLPQINQLQSLQNKNAKIRAYADCFEFPVGFVCDYFHSRGFNNNSEIEVSNLLKLADAQEVWSSLVFDGEIRFKAIGHIIYDQPENGPWADDANISLSIIHRDFMNSWKKPESWEKYRLLIKIGITNTNFGTDYKDKFIWGYGAGNRREYEMGTIIIKGFFNRYTTKILLAHELGHVFGADHDATVGYVMYPNIDQGSGSWSTDSKKTVNSTLNDLNSSKWLRICPAMALNWSFTNDSLALVWQTNYDNEGDSFTLEQSIDEQKTWNKIAEIKANLKFKYQTKLPSKLISQQQNYFRVRQRGINEITSNIATIIITEVEAESQNQETAISPNPFDNQLIIKTITPSIATVFDISGRFIQQINITEKQVILDTSSWKNGTYFIQFDTSPIKVFKLIK
jgi:Secretion system C-terminal sorting domain